MAMISHPGKDTLAAVLPRMYQNTMIMCVRGHPARPDHSGTGCGHPEDGHMEIGLEPCCAHYISYERQYKDQKGNCLHIFCIFLPENKANYVGLFKNCD